MPSEMPYLEQWLNSPVLRDCALSRPRGWSQEFTLPPQPDTPPTRHSAITLLLLTPARITTFHNISSAFPNIIHEENTTHALTARFRSLSATRRCLDRCCEGSSSVGPAGGSMDALPCWQAGALRAFDDGLKRIECGLGREKMMRDVEMRCRV
jgi:hypothetical protein